MDSDEEEEEEDEQGRLTETGKAVKKALAKLQKNRVYASDEEKDPYASVSPLPCRSEPLIPVTTTITTTCTPKADLFLPPPFLSVNYRTKILPTRTWTRSTEIKTRKTRNHCHCHRKHPSQNPRAKPTPRARRLFPRSQALPNLLPPNWRIPRQ